MPLWHIQDGDKTRAMEEDRLRSQLRRSALSGVELARPEGVATWKPLHEWPVFAEEVPFEGRASDAGRKRARNGFLWHLAAFVGVVGFLTLDGGSPTWAIFWLLVLVAHGARTLSVLRERATDPLPEVATPVAPAVAAETELGFLEEAAEAISELGAVGGDRIDAAALTQAAEALHAARCRLVGGADLGIGETLRRELQEARGRLEASTEPSDSEVYRAEVEAIAARIEAWQDASTAVARLEARQRTLLHQFHALHLDLARPEGTPGGQVEVEALVSRLREEAIADAEVDAGLARAREASRRQRS